MIERGYIICIVFLIGSVNISFTQDLKENLFGKVTERIVQAESDNIYLFSPTITQNANETYKNALSEFESGSNLNDIKEMIEKVNISLDKAYKVAEVGRVTFKDVLEARNDASKSEAKLNVPELWSDASEKLREAGEDLEDGDMNDADENAKEAEQLFKKAELEAIKKIYLIETKQKIRKAEEIDVDDNAPITLNLSKQLVKDAEKELSENRYDVDLPRSIAKRAYYQIDHAFYIDQKVKEFNENDMTLEEIILLSENELARISNVLGLVPRFDKGLKPATDSIISQIAEFKEERENLNEKVASLSEELEIVKGELSGISTEKSELANRLDTFNMIKEKYAAIDRMFSNNEAEVLRDKDEIIIRLVGLNFDVGKAEIKPENFGLLTKLQNAIKEFPKGKIEVQGHTDSFGGDAANLILSSERADAVKKYIIANMEMDDKRINSKGYGESNPIANNETKEGRAKNRRIDLILKMQ